jgi:5-methylcytosine-specific restriction endonuclease McrA
LPGNTTINYLPDGFRKGRRGFNLEVDRKNPKGKYSPNNCVLACYPCNNAKSDVFSHAEFLLIGQSIREAKTRKLTT